MDILIYWLDDIEGNPFFINEIISAAASGRNGNELPLVHLIYKWAPIFFLLLNFYAPLLHYLKELFFSERGEFTCKSAKMQSVRSDRRFKQIFLGATDARTGFLQNCLKV